MTTFRNVLRSSRLVTRGSRKFFRLLLILLGLFATRGFAAPIFTSPSTGNVNEGVAPGTAVYTAIATEPGNTLSYSLSGTDAVAFAINSTTGVVTINNSPDFETKSSYSFTAKATDTNGTFSTLGVTISVNDLPPVITSSTTANVNEGVPANSVVYTAVAFDPAGGTVTYVLNGTDAAALTINASTGVVTINNSPDFETKSSYSFNIKASDPNGQFTTQAVTLNINDLPPVITSSTTANVNEGVAANSIVYTAVATDPAGGTVTYALTGTDAAAFTIGATTGIVTIKNSPDYETKSSYSFTIKASDLSGQFNTQSVTININDLPPVITSPTTANVNEGIAPNTSVYTAVAADPAGGTVTYALTGTDALAFTINASTGVVTINNSPDFETKSSYAFTVKASDPTGQFNTRAVTVNVNDLPPVITSSTTANINESVPANSVVYTAVAFDPAGGTVTYVLNGTDAAAFTIDTSTGVVTINNSPDFETKSSYSFNIKASDPNGQFTTQTLTINVNDLPPVITSPTTTNVNEGVPANSVVYTAVAADPAGGTVTYVLTGTDAAAFTINASTGVVTINSVPNYQTKSSYNFNIKASDPTGAFNIQGVTVIIKQAVAAPNLSGMSFSNSTGFTFRFTNVTGATFTALASTNLSQSLSNWTVLGVMTESPAGHYQFTDPQATNNPRRFYGVRSP